MNHTHQNIVLGLLANKIDVDPSQREVTTELAQAFASKKNMIYKETSAKTGEGIKEVKGKFWTF